jgi:hypothetical protein
MLFLVRKDFFGGGMLKQLQLEQLSDEHLLLFQKHIELGQEHLLTLLSQKGVDELCAVDEPSMAAQRRIESNVTERAGALTGPFNGVLSAVLGAWLGLDGFLGYFLNSRALFQGVIAVSVGLGVWIAMINYRKMKRDIQRRVEERTLQDIQLHILDFLIRKRATEIKQKTAELNELLKTLRVTDEEIPPIPSTEFDSEEECLSWLEKLDCVVRKHQELENPQVYDLFAWEIAASKEKIRESLAKKPAFSCKALPPILEMLMRTPLRDQKKEASWLSKSWKQILLGTILTLYGGFSSMFVYLNGAPEITAQLGWESVHAFLTNPWVRMAEMAGAVGSTLYFAFSFINANRKGFVRDQEIAKTQKEVVQQQGKLSMFNDRLSKVKETLLSLQRIEVLLITSRKLSSLISR